MESFFDQYRNKAESNTDFPFLEADWDKLEKKLNDQGHAKGPLPLFFWPVIAGTLLLSTLVFFKKSNTSSTQINPALIPVFTQTVYDTIIERDTIYIEKPMYIVRYAEKRVIEDRPETIKHMEDLTAINNELRNMVLQQHFNLEKTQESFPILDASVENKERAISSQSSPTLTPYKEVEIKPTPAELEIPLVVSLPLAADTLNAWKKLLKSFLPARLDIGLVSGVPLILNPQIRNKPGYLLGAKVFLSLQSHFEIQAGLAYSKLFYEGHQMDEKLGIPIQHAPLNDLLFAKAEVLRPGFNLDLGLHYSFLNEKRIVPKIGVGIGFAFPQKSEVTYDFRSPSSPVEWSIDTHFKPAVKNPYSVQWYGALNYKIHPRWTWLLQGILHQKLRSGDFLSKRVDLVTAIAYRLY